MANLEDIDLDNVAEPIAHDVLPKGTKVLCVLVDSPEKDNKAGDGKYIALAFESVDEKHPGRKFWENLNHKTDRTDDKAKKMIQISNGKLGRLLRAAGFMHKPKDTAEIHGIPIVLTLGVQPAKGEWPARNTIENYEAPVGDKPPEKKPGAAPWAR